MTSSILPTPSSSYCQTTSPLLNPSLSLSRVAKPKKYGSFLYQRTSDDNLSFDEAPPTPPHTTISPNDEDEGLYLLWTHQLLREQGLRPASCRTSSYHDDEEHNGHQSNDSDNDDESSQSESMTSIIMTAATYDKHHSKLLLSSSSFSSSSPQSPQSSSFFSFLSSFPFCSCPSS